MPTTETAVARVAAYVEAATLQTTDTTKGLADSFEIHGTWSPHTREVHNLLLVDLRDLLAIIADLCQEEGPCATSCTNCRTRLCETHGVGVYATCGHQDAELLCDDCRWDACPDCATEAAADFRSTDRRWAS